MSNVKKSNLGFRPARVEEKVQAEINKQETTRLNIEITKDLATKLKMMALKEDKTLKELVTSSLENMIK
jgi:hypothetical protein